jgi:hypothetical protein
MGNLANDYRGLKRYNEAEKLDREVVDIRRRVLGSEHADTLTTLYYLGLDLRGLRKYGEADNVYRSVLDAPPHSRTFAGAHAERDAAACRSI